MLNILGVGASSPETRITDEFLREISCNLSPKEEAIFKRLGIRERASSVPLEVIRATHNKDPLSTMRASTDSPTSLGLRAVKQALDRAGITAEQIGLAIGDCCAPHQLTPSEAQRVAGELNLKIPCFDMNVGPAAFPLFIETINNWKPERLPDYILCISSNTPTQRVDYSSSALAAYTFGDCAGAVILSPRHSGRLSIVDSYLRRNSEGQSTIHVGTTANIDPDSMIPQSELEQLIAGMVRRCNEKSTSSSGRSLLIGPELYAADCRKAASSLGYEASNFFSTAANVGYSVGSSAINALSHAWDQLKSGDRLTMIHAGDGIWSGSVMMSA